ncbi:MAG: hypothetical protein ACTSX0_10990 [Promethearchaeota archaeon]
MPKKSSKSKKNVRIIACEHLVSLNEVSNTGVPLCRCNVRKFVMSPYNIVCQVCEQYRERRDGKTHDELYVADEAPDFHYDLDDIDISDDDFGDETLELEDDLDLDEEEEEIEIPKKRKKRVARKIVEEDEEDEEDEEEEFEDEEDVALVIGVAEEKVPEEELDYVDEREEGLGKKHGKIFEEDEIEEEDEELEEELDELDDDIVGIEDVDEDLDDELDDNSLDSETDASSIDFEKEVIAKIKKVGSGDTAKQICPFCQKTKVSVLRHLPKCKRVPPEILKAYKLYKSKKK